MEMSIARRILTDLVMDSSAFAAEVVALPITVCSLVSDVLEEMSHMEARLEEAEDDRSELDALYAAGVDNWDGYGEAMERKNGTWIETGW